MIYLIIQFFPRFSGQNNIISAWVSRGRKKKTEKNEEKNLTAETAENAEGEEE
jgi:hypothetical protein